jgi:hypothetical protein
MAKAKPIQPELVKDLRLDPLTGRNICVHCFNDDHHKCPLTSCQCMHKDAPEKGPRKKKDASAQAGMEGFGTISV